jgi:hypothetical protein
MSAVPTSDTVTEFWAFMTGYYQTQVIEKSNSVAMQAVAAFLGSIGILDANAFLTSYATTLDHSIYLPFTPGVAAPGWDLFDQIVVCAHEHEHVVESTSLGLVTYDFRYVTDTPSRARYEAEAYRSAFELSWWNSKTVPSPQKVANLLTGYGCTATDVAMAETILSVTAKEVELGAILNPATSVALGWLNVHAAYLRAPSLSKIYLTTKCLCPECDMRRTSEQYA